MVECLSSMAGGPALIINTEKNNFFKAKEAYHLNTELWLTNKVVDNMYVPQPVF